MGILGTISLDDFRGNYLQSVRQTDINRCRLPDSFYLEQLRAGAAWLARDLDIKLLGNAHQLYPEEKDYTEWDPHNWCLKSLVARPVIAIESMKFQIGDHDAYEVAAGWTRISSAIGGQIVIIRGKTAPEVASALVFWARSYFAGRNMPLFFHVTTRAGFESVFPGTVSAPANSNTVTVADYTGENDIYTTLAEEPWVYIDGTAYRVDQILSTTQFTVHKAFSAEVAAGSEMIVAAYPEDMREFVQRIAAILVMSQIQAYVAGTPGVSGKSSSLDSLAQSRNYVAGKGYGPYSAQMTQYADRVKELRDALKSVYAPVNISAW